MKPRDVRKKHEDALGHHDFLEDEVLGLRENLLSWYAENKRALPWRDLCKTTQDLNQKAYAVWVSEIMLQQTQVATVIDYYNRWMERWPTLQDLAKATLEEVNEMWAGLGYYSRGKRLREGAMKVVEVLNGRMPKDAVSLTKELPGVGRYTAGAVASIALDEATGVVDGNVVRVLSRLRTIGADSTSSNTMEAFWTLANKIVDPKQPGDFNQAMMELGAMLCTPKSPQCNNCPIKDYCLAYKKTDAVKEKAAEKLKASLQGEKVSQEVGDIEDVNCHLCLPSDTQWQDSLGVCNFPQKPKKKEAREETYVVGIFERVMEERKELLIVQRPETGLLAGLWEFPSLLVTVDVSEKEAGGKLSKFIKDFFEIDIKLSADCRFIGEIVHVFSHVHHTYKIYNYTFTEENCQSVSQNRKTANKTQRPMLWVSKEEFQESAVSTGMKKVFVKYEKSLGINTSCKSKPKKRKHEEEKSNVKQRVLDSFFKPKTRI